MMAAGCRPGTRPTWRSAQSAPDRRCSIGGRARPGRKLHDRVRVAGSEQGRPHPGDRTRAGLSRKAQGGVGRAWSALGQHLDPAGDLAAILDLQPAAAGGAEHLARRAHDQVAAGGQRAVDGAGHLRVLDLDLALEHAARRDRQLGRVDHAGLDRALHHQALGVLHRALNADAAADDERAALGRRARSWRRPGGCIPGGACRHGGLTGCGSAAWWGSGRGWDTACGPWRAPPSGGLDGRAERRGRYPASGPRWRHRDDVVPAGGTAAPGSLPSPRHRSGCVV